MSNPKLAVAVLGPALFFSILTGPAAAAPGAAARPPTVARALQFEALRLERSGQNRLLLRAFINGKPALLAVDSGAAVSVIASHRLRHFGLTPARARADIPARLSLNGAFNDVAIARTLQLGALNLLDEPMVVVDLAASPNAAERSDEEAIDGVIGADILFPTQAVLDCRAQVLILKMDPRVRGSAPGLDFSGLRRVKIHVTPGYTLYVDVRLNGRRARLMVDTGAFATTLQRRFLQGMKIPLRASAYTSSGVNMKERDVHVAMISRFSVGPVEMRDKQVGVTNLDELFYNDAPDSALPIAGLLGPEILRRHNGIIDFGTRTLYLKR